MARAIDLGRIQQVPQSGVVVDTNVLLLVFSEMTATTDPRNTQYTKAIVAAYNSGKILLVDFVIVSEMINRIMRIAYNEYVETVDDRSRALTFKDYRASDLSRTFRESSEDSLRQVLRLCKVTSDGHSTASLLELALVIREGTADINDFHIARMCIESDYALLTDDGDMGTFEGLHIITNNPRLLR